MDEQGKRSQWRFFVPSVLGVLMALIATAVVAAMSVHQVTMFNNGGSRSAFSIGIPTWYASAEAGGVTTSRTHWLNILIFAVVLYLVAMPLGRLITDAARPLRAGLVYVIVGLAVAGLAVAAGAGFSRHYWGYWFARPAVDYRVAEALSLNRLTPIDNLDVASGAGVWIPLTELHIRGGGDWSDTSQLSGSREPGGYYTLQGRVLNALEDAGHNLAFARSNARTDAELAGLLGLVTGSGWFDPGSGGGYTNSAATLTGYAIDFDGPHDGQEDLLLLSLSSGGVSNDHFAYYELLFGPPATPGDETTRPLIAANRFYYDVAGIEGMEWYTIALPLGVVGLIIAIPLASAILVVIGTRRRNTTLRRGFAVEPVEAPEG